MDHILLKRRLRSEAAEKRACLNGAAAKSCTTEIAVRLSMFDFPEKAVLSAYWPLKNELDLRPAMNRLFADGRDLCLPVVVGRDKPLVFRRWTPGTALTAGPYGTEQPDETAETVEPSVLLLPLLAFDRKGGRLGYGGGYYDRTVRELRRKNKDILVVGTAFSVQEIDSVPTDDSDERLDVVVTEHETIEVFR